MPSVMHVISKDPNLSVFSRPLSKTGDGMERHSRPSATLQEPTRTCWETLNKPCKDFCHGTQAGNGEEGADSSRRPRSPCAFCCLQAPPPQALPPAPSLQGSGKRLFLGSVSSTGLGFCRRSPGGAPGAMPRWQQTLGSACWPPPRSERVPQRAAPPAPTGTDPYGIRSTHPRLKVCWHRPTSHGVPQPSSSRQHAAFNQKALVNQ